MMVLIKKRSKFCTRNNPIMTNISFFLIKIINNFYQKRFFFVFFVFFFVFVFFVFFFFCFFFALQQGDQKRRKAHNGLLEN